MVGRIYLGMHSLVDIIGGLAVGWVILAFWLTVHEYIDHLGILIFDLDLALFACCSLDVVKVFNEFFF